GQGPLRHGLERAAGELGVGEQVVFHGAVDRAAMPGLYRAADLGLLSSRHESQALVVFEAAACGRATVGPAVGALPDILPANAAIAPGDPESLAAAIDSLIVDGGRLAAGGAESAALVRAEGSLERSVAALNWIYAAAGQR
ncbi:MAG TPA: glycosyltransferase family 4 protein, partial [Herpetosiphonaceae bacterium]|nr:glycosyltransferase family 4 protein [Herpetosiphonaceae bacterium]